ncbi:MAG TPA: CAP domain-containing protein [Acidimicrobiales bacterium]
MGAGPVAMCGNLTQAAQAHSDDQATMRKMTHIGSDGSTLVVRLNRSGYLPAASWGVGENVAWNFSSPSSVMTAWMNSAGHRANIVNPAFTHVGFGLTNFGNGYYWTQDFGHGGRC